MKRRGQGEGTLYQRPDGKWMAQLDLGWRDGKRVRRSLYAPIRREVVEKLKAARKAVDAGLTPTSDRLTVAAYLADWLDANRSTVRPSTWTRYAGMVRTHHIPRLGRLPLTKLAAGDVERMLRDMADTGLSARTCHHARAILRTALARAVRHGLILRNAAGLATPPRVEHREVESWDAAQVRTFLETIRGHRLEALFTVAVVTGLRQGELLGLRWSDVDMTAGTLTVRHSLQRVDGTLQLVEPKTPRSRRTVPLPELALRALRTRRTAR